MIKLAAATKLLKKKTSYSPVAGAVLHYGIRPDKGIPILNHIPGRPDAALSRGTNFDQTRSNNKR